MADANAYVPQQHDAQAPLDEADPLELHAPCLTIGSLDIQHEKKIFKEMLARANTAIREFRADVHYAAQIPNDAEAKVERLFTKYKSVFSTKLTGRPPCAVPPIRIPLKPDAKPSISKARRYPPQKQAFLSTKCKDFQYEQLVRKVNTAEWVSAPLLVPKPPPAMWRMTIDLRPINHSTVKDTRPMPNMETMLLDVANDSFFGEADLVHAFFQVAIHEDDRHLHTFRGADAHSLYEPLRSLQGAKNSGIHLQVHATELLSEIKGNILLWLDDWLLHSKTWSEHMTVLEKFLKICTADNFTLSPEKCNLIAKRAKWCGRKITAEGVTLDPRRIEGLLDMQRPEYAADLQQFICAVNWMRNGIPEYSVAIAPMQTLLGELTARHGAKKVKLAKVLLDNTLWTKQLQASFEQMKVLIATRVELTHLDSAQRLCLHTDASDHFHAAVLTQVPIEDLEKPQGDQRHSPLAFISGSFKGAMSRWSVFEKEAFAIVNAMSRLDYLTCCGLTNIYTDHRNLVFIFDPQRQQPTMPAYLVSKIQRWALILSQFEYIVSHVPGEYNYFPDLISRWGAKRDVKSRRLYIPVPSLAKNDINIDTFLDQVVEAQASLPTDERQGLTVDTTGTHKCLQSKGKLYIPKAATLLKLSILVVAHCGAAGHRARDITSSRVKNYFTWVGLNDDVQTFCNKCLHCASTKGSIRIPRPQSHTLHASKPNEILHFDYLYMGEGEDGYKYILILKDDFSNYIWLFLTRTCDTCSAVKALTAWNAAFGLAKIWISDQGSHFKNEVLQKTSEALQTKHHFTSAYHAQSNGSVEVVCREVIRGTRALLSEYNLGVSSWPRLTKMVQMVINQSPSPKLGNNITPLTAFTQQKPENPLTYLFTQQGEAEAVKTLTMVKARQLMHHEAIAKSISSMHRKVAATANARREEQTRRHNKSTNVRSINFEVGDYVLVGCPQPQKVNKLTVMWSGPAKVTKFISPLVAQTEDLLSGKLREIHVSRMKFYDNAFLDVNEDLTDYLKDQHASLYLVDEFKAVSKTRSSFKVNVSWVGFPNEDTWEKLESLNQDVPARLREFLNSTPSDPLALAALAKLSQS